MPTTSTPLATLLIQKHKNMRLWGPRSVRSRRHRPEGARGRRQRIVRNLEATSVQAAIKVGITRQSKRP
jgi:hypothetical protein